MELGIKYKDMHLRVASKLSETLDLRYKGKKMVSKSSGHIASNALSINECMVITVRNYTKADIRYFSSCPILLSIFTL